MNNVIISSIHYENLRFNFTIQILYICKILKKAVNKRRKTVQDIIIVKKKSLKSGL